MMNLRRVTLFSAVSLTILPSAFSQTANLSFAASALTPIAASAPTAVPSLVPFAGTAIGADGKPLGGGAAITFQVYKDEAGGEPLWTETQMTALDLGGHYKVQLGATTPNGLPSDLFSSGEARWLEVQIAGQGRQSRILLASVPYALKAGDATTLGGLPASAFLLARSQRVTGTALDSSMNTPAATANVTTAGGTSGYLPVFTGSSTVADSILFQNSLGVGINDIPNGALDVNGKSIFRGPLQVARIGNATTTSGVKSNPFSFYAQAYDSSTHFNVGPSFQLQAEPTGNNTTAPGATLNLLYGNGVQATPVETGFRINPNGTLHFAPGQTFPGAGSGTITGVTAGTDLTGGGTSGNVTVNLDTTKIITKIAPGLGLSGGGTSGTVTLSIDETKIPSLTDNPVFTGTITANGHTLNQPAVAANGTNGAVGMEAISDTGWAGYFESSPVEHASLSVGNYANFDYSGLLPEGIYSTATSPGAFGIFSFAPAGVGVFGETVGQNTTVYGESTTATTFLFPGGATAVGVWGDISDAASADNFPTSFALGGVAGTADNWIAGWFENNSDSEPTLEVFNQYDENTGPTGLFRTLQATTPKGTCGIGGNGNLTCTGQIKTLASTGGSRMIETYAMQSSENWMEDFGSGRLSNGTATVQLESVYMQTVNAGVEYHVFLTPKGDCKGLYVSNESAAGFEVRELGRGNSNVAFDYRIVSKRRGYEAQRLVDVTERYSKEMARATDHFKRAAAARQAKSIRKAQPMLRPQTELGPRLSQKTPSLSTALSAPPATNKP